MNQGNFNIQNFIDNQNQLQNEFNTVYIPRPVVQQMPNFSAESIIDQRDDEKMKILCNFTCNEFENLYSFVQIPMEIAHQGGRNSYYSPKTVFLITLCFLKTAMNFTQLQVNFGFTSIYIGMLIDKTVSICCPILSQKAIKWISMIQNIQKHALFRFFPNCLVAVDASVQRIPRPKIDQASYFSGKHGFHCLKMQVAVGPQGLAVDINGPFKGAVHDFNVLQQTQTLNKINNERNRFIMNYPS